MDELTVKYFEGKKCDFHSLPRKKKFFETDILKRWLNYICGASIKWIFFLLNNIGEFILECWLRNELHCFIEIYIDRWLYIGLPKSSFQVVLTLNNCLIVPIRYSGHSPANTYSKFLGNSMKCKNLRKNETFSSPHYQKATKNWSNTHESTWNDTKSGRCENTENPSEASERGCREGCSSSQIFFSALISKKCRFFEMVATLIAKTKIRRL